MTWEILVGVLVFAAGNVAYFEIQRVIQFLRTHFNESKRYETTRIHPFHGTAAANMLLRPSEKSAQKDERPASCGIFYREQTYHH